MLTIPPTTHANFNQEEKGLLLECKEEQGPPLWVWNFNLREGTFTALHLSVCRARWRGWSGAGSSRAGPPPWWWTWWTRTRQLPPSPTHSHYRSVTSLVFLCDKSVYTDISYRESLVYLLLSNLFLDIRNTAQQICNRELVRQLLQTCIIAFSDTSLWQNYTAFWQTFFHKILSLANTILYFNFL